MTYNFVESSGAASFKKCIGGYCFGFNGKEKTDEWNGGGNMYDYGFRIYDPRIGRFLSVDPLTKSYPMLTPYQFASNRPIEGIDLDGLEFLPYRSSQIGVVMGYNELTNSYCLSLAVKLHTPLAAVMGLGAPKPEIPDGGEATNYTYKDNYSSFSIAINQPSKMFAIAGGVNEIINMVAGIMNMDKNQEMADILADVRIEEDAVNKSLELSSKLYSELLPEINGLIKETDLINFMIDGTIPFYDIYNQYNQSYADLVKYIGNKATTNYDKIMSNNFSFSEYMHVPQQTGSGDIGSYSGLPATIVMPTGNSADHRLDQLILDYKNSIESRENMKIPSQIK